MNLDVPLIGNLPLDEPGLEGAVYRTGWACPALVACPGIGTGQGKPSPYDTYEAGVGQWPHAPEIWYPREDLNPCLHVRSVVSSSIERRGQTLGSGPENRTLPRTLIWGNYRLIRPARTPALTTLEARLGIEPRLSALQADAFPLGYRALAGAVGIGPTVSETAALPRCHAPVLLGLSVVKEQ